MRQGHSDKPLILTGADHLFARTLFQFLLSAERLGEHKRSDWLVYDLGFSANDTRILCDRFGWATLKIFPFTAYPPHVAMEKGSYAWKPILIGNHADREGPVLWFDSATILKRPLDKALEVVTQQGFWALRSQEPLDLKCDVRVMDAARVPLEVRHFREYAAGAVGFDPRLPLGRKLLTDWAAHAKIEDHIVPAGYPSFHKHDQALLNCLLAKAAHDGSFVPTAEEIDICSANPCPMISTRNFVPNRRPLWADLAMRSYFTSWKFADRLYHKLRIFDGTCINGRRRRRNEHFSVKLWQLPDGRETVIPTPPDGYYADPFIVHRDGTLWLFVEEFVYSRNRGHLTVLGLDENLDVTFTERVELTPDYVALDCHASFPFIFELDGETYMIPETHERRAIDLFVCEHWPTRWRLVRRLVFGVDAADTMVIQLDGTWYLITSVRGQWPNRHLEIYHTPDLLSGGFTPHPINKQGIYGNKLEGTGRNAGYLGKQADRSLIRLMQDSVHYYGESILPMRIHTLTEHVFHEEPTESIDLLPGITAGFPTHHATRSQNIIAFDTRDRAG